MTDDTERLTHVDKEGRPAMVDVTPKETTTRRAVAEGRLAMARKTLDHVRSGQGPKGDPIRVAELAGIMGGKRTADLIPLCHQLPGTTIQVQLEIDETLPGVIARAEAVVSGQTGVEMEALTAVTISLLTLYDMTKAIDRGMRIEDIRLVRKEGGRSGTWTAEE